MPSKLTPYPHFHRGLEGNSSIGLESDASHPSVRLTRRMSNLSVVLFGRPPLFAFYWPQTKTETGTEKVTETGTEFSDRA